MKSYQELFAELKRRHVFKVTAVYGVVVFGLIQVADPLAKSLLLPDVFLTYVSAILLLGFPLALVLTWAFELTPEGVRRTETAAPGVIEAIVAQPASKRWPSGVMALVGVVALLGGAWWAGVRSGRSGLEAGAGRMEARADSLQLAFTDADADGRPSVAVLAFANMSGEVDQEYFSDGITEELLNTLVKIRQLRVAARTSAFAFKGRQVDVRQIGDSLGVEYVIEGSVRKAGNRLRITAQLIDAKDGSHLWSEQYDRELNDVFAIQTEIAGAIAAQLRVPLGLGENEELVSPTADLTAYDLYLAGRAKMRERGKSVFEAARLFEAAVARDSNWAPAWAGLAESLALRPFYGPDPDEPQVPADSAYWARSLDDAEAAARRALELDPENASATVALANALRDHWQWSAAEAAYVRALSLDPDNVEAYQQYAEFLAYVGRSGEALVVARRALSLDRSPIRLNVAGYIAIQNDSFDEAIEYVTEGIVLDREDRVYWLHDFLLTCYVATGQWRKAREVLVGMLAEMPPQRREELLRTWPPGDAPPRNFDPDRLPADRRLLYSPAPLWMALGKPDRALANLEASVRGRPPFSHAVELFFPQLDPLRDDPRFQELLRIRGLEGRRPIRSTTTAAGTP